MRGDLAGVLRRHGRAGHNGETVAEPDGM